MPPKTSKHALVRKELLNGKVESHIGSACRAVFAGSARQQTAIVTPRPV
jgi:hypothetical protein